MILSQPNGAVQLHCTTSANCTAHPYYIVAAGYRNGDLGNKLLHRLCSWLNLRGHESWIITTDTHAPLWTPKLQDDVRAQHHAAHKCPIVVFFDEKLGSNAGMGTKVRYEFNPFTGNTPANLSNDVVFSWAGGTGDRQLRLPFLNLESIASTALRADKRQGTLVYADQFLASGGMAKELPPNATRLTAADLCHEETLTKHLSTAETLYLYEPSALSVVARAYGCAVAHVCPDNAGSPVDSSESIFGHVGLATTPDWRNTTPPSPWSAAAFLAQYADKLQGWEDELTRFVGQTQALASSTPHEQAWPEEIVLGLPATDESLESAAWRADKIKQLRVNRQLANWSARSTLREIDGEIYGAYVAGGQLPAVAAVVYADHNMDALADTLDSLAAGLLQPSELTIVSAEPSPFPSTDSEGLRWIQVSADLCSADAGTLGHVQAPWTLAIKAGTTLQPNSTLEFAIAAQHTAATVVYADDDVWVKGTPQHPHFKPHANIEWLRSTNYLGDAVLVATPVWGRHPTCHRFEGIYDFALRALETKGTAGLAHIDTLLTHGKGQLNNEQLELEHTQVKEHLARMGLDATVTDSKHRGLRDVVYRHTAQSVSVVIPSATQTGYLSCLLQSMVNHPSPLLLEVLVVADLEFAARAQRAVDEIAPPFTTRVVAIPNQPYSHAKALNSGAAEALGNILLFADDDTEIIHNQWLELLCGVFAQADVTTAAPRLVKPGSPNPIMCGGPAYLGVGGVYAAYCGEKGNVLESGPYGRLQATQDVSAFAPHFFLVRTHHFRQMQGFDESEFPLFFPVLDFGLRASNAGYRHVWSPLVSVLHQGGKTLEEQHRLPENTLALRQAELKERRHITQKWTEALAADRNYNRNLSLTLPFDLEQDIVIDWQPHRRDRPRTVALPLSSGSGQYRVVEPLNALQDKGKVQSCVVFPLTRDLSRVPTSIELARSGLDRLIVQNAIGDLHLARLEEYRLNMPKMGIIHMLDDLFGNLPSKHHLHNYHKREGNTRLRRALELSDRLVVTTQPLKDYYQEYIADVRVIPNSLVESAWFDLPVSKKPRNGKLRVGWAGAQQHLGDLDMIQSVVEHFAGTVDWVFMGMCPPSIQPHVKEVHSFVSIDVYPQTLANLDLDIAIAPLEDNLFNQCKSNLRLLEYGAMGWPVVCSDVYPYRTDAPPVLRVSNHKDDWVAALEKLISNSELRNAQGQKLNQWVKNRYSISMHADSWFKAIFDNVQK